MFAFFVYYTNFLFILDMFCSDDFGSGLEIDGNNEGEGSTSEKNLVAGELDSQREVDRRHLAYVNNNDVGLNGSLVAPRLAAPDSTRFCLCLSFPRPKKIFKEPNQTPRPLKKQCPLASLWVKFSISEIC